MKKYFYFLIVLFIVTLSSFQLHKFYVSIYQIQYAEKTKMLQITSRIFVDDLNAVLQKKYQTKTNIGEASESENDLILLKKYMAENFSIKVNNQVKVINFLSKEIESNVVVCYYNVKSISKIKSIEIQNTTLFDLNNDQQNIIQLTILGKKKSILLTNENVKGLLNL